MASFMGAPFPLRLENRPRLAVLLLGAGACLAALIVNGYSVWDPFLVMDDFQLLAQSWTWQAAWQNFWLPTNEHAMPPGRITVWLQVCLAGSPANLPFVCALQGPLAVLVAMVLVYLFMRRETGQPFPALLAMALFGVTSTYQQAVYWFASSFSILTLDTLLLALLAAQRWRQTGRIVHLLLCVGWCALAPCWFASGILAGPLCCLYLLPGGSRSWIGRWVIPFVPALGTAIFLVVSLPLTWNHINHLEHYGSKTAVQSFNPLTGMVNTGRAIVDNLVPGLLGVGGLGTFAVPVVPVLLAGLALVVAWWWRQAGQPRLMLLALGLILTSYGLAYSARADWPYEKSGAPLYQVGWSRYHLLPQLGLALFISAGFIRSTERSVRSTPGSAPISLSARQIRVLAILILVLLIVQLPRGIIGTYAFNSDTREQLAVLRQIAATDALCRQHHISAADARAALPARSIPGSMERVDSWELLRGSGDPRPLPPEEIRRLLEGAESP
jgi:hypothetical protein